MKDSPYTPVINVVTSLLTLETLQQVLESAAFKGLFLKHSSQSKVASSLLIYINVFLKMYFSF